MAALAIGLFVLLFVFAAITATALYLRAPKSGLPPELRARRRALADRLRRALERVPSRPPLAAPALRVHPEAAAIEAHLHAARPRAALAEAERVLAQDPAEPGAHVLLARALLACDELDAAIGEVARARELGASGAMLDYLEARAAHVRRLRAENAGQAEVAGAPVPSLVTPYEILLLQLEQQRRRSDRTAAVWLAGQIDRTLESDQIARLVAEHFEACFRDLELLTRAIETDPGFAEALYHAARLAVKSGFIDEGRDLFEKIEPLMAGVPERSYYDRDLAELRDREEAVISWPEVHSGSGRKITRLKVID